MKCTFTLDLEAITGNELEKLDIRRLRIDPRVAMDITRSDKPGSQTLD